MKILKKRCWHDEHEHLFYFTINDGNKQIWSSSWSDIRDLSELEDIDCIRNEVIEACNEHGLEVDCSSNVIDDWKTRCKS